jgi:hypothetical protein
MLRGEFSGKNKVVVTVKEPESEEEKPALHLEGVVVEVPSEEAESLAAGPANGT